MDAITRISASECTWKRRKHAKCSASYRELRCDGADNGNTIVVIEHNLDVIKTADWIIDLGPEGGSGGGEVIACGPPIELANVAKSYTGQYLKKLI